MKPKRILQIIGSMDIGGAETMLMNIYKEINKDIIQFDFFLSDNKEGYYEHNIKQLGGKIYRTQKKSLHPIKYKNNLKHLIKINKYDVIHIHASSGKDFYSLAVLKAENIKKRIYHSHSSCGINKCIQKVFRRFVNKYSTHKIACSDLAANWMYGRDRNELQIIYNPINVKLFMFNKSDREEIRGSLKLDDQIVFIHVGRFNKVKNHHFLIKIFNEIYKRNRNVMLLLVGEGSEKNKIINEVHSLKLSEKVVFLGLKSDVFKYLSAADLFIMPSFHEGLPVTIVEAQANGLKSLLSNTITNDINKTNLISYLSLKSSASNWAIEALNLTKMTNVSNREKFNTELEKIFDVKYVAKQFEELYLK